VKFAYGADICITPISRPTDATCDRLLFSIYMCITLHVSSVKRSSSGVPHRTYSLQFLCLCLSAALSCKSFLQDSAADTNAETGGCMYDEGLLMMSAWRSKHVELYSIQFLCLCLRHCLVRNSYKTVPQTDTNTETEGCMYGEGLLMMSDWRSKHVELYTYR
jgi:hypothetical protein